MKECSKCGRVWPLSEYQLRDAAKGTFRSICRECRREYNRQNYLQNAEKYKTLRRRNQPRYRQQRRELLREYLQNKECVDCGECDPLVLEFDHVSGEKFGDIGTMLSHYCWARILDELKM